MRSDILSTTPILLVGAAMVALAGCGGGGSTSSTPSGPSSPSAPSTYTVGGTLAGLGTNESVSLQDNGGNALTVSANGSFSFPLSLDAGAAYAVTVKSHTPGIACSVTSGSGTVGSANVTVGVSCGAGTETILYSFGASGDWEPGGLIMDSAGNLFGMTEEGGAYGDGTVFKIDTTGKETILYSFGASATDGEYPEFGGLIMDGAGNFYGTTSEGGSKDDGTVFKIDTGGKETVLYSFGASSGDGIMPLAGLILDSNGALYGTTAEGGANDDGTVFKIDATSKYTVLYSFGANTTDGTWPQAALIMDSAGNLYGTTMNGGANRCGTVFKIDNAGNETVLYSFGASATDGATANTGLILDSNGNIYGTTFQGGANLLGTVFKIDTTGKETIFYSFGASGTDAIYPSGLILDSAGNFYGTTMRGGANDDGTVFKIDTTGKESILYSFGTGPTDGENPIAGLIVDSAGNLYGTADGGGVYTEGTVFKID